MTRKLYDHDSNPHESRNVAAETKHGETMRELAGMLKGGWKSVRPAAAETTQ